MRVVRVVPDVGAIDKEFDYLVPDALGDQVRVGTMVRVDLHGRSVAAWVVAVDVEPVPGVDLKPVRRVSGYGPPADVIDVARWASRRWAGRLAPLLRTASPARLVRSLPGPMPDVGLDSRATDLEVPDAALTGGAAVLRWPPAHDGFAVIEAALERGPALILHPSISVAHGIVRRIRRAGLPAVMLDETDGWREAAAGGFSVVGSRRAAFAPVPRFRTVVVLDAHDEVYQEERTPTWSAVDVAVERAARAGVPCVLVSPCPPLDLLRDRSLVTVDRAAERAGWPVVEAVDRRADDPSSGLFSDRVVAAVRGPGRVVCILNRTGRARLLACAACRELARCERCASAVAQVEGRLTCARCGTERPVVCATCGGQRLKTLRPGVSRVRDDLAALAREPVIEVTADTDARAELTRVVVGTEAVLHRVHRARTIVFLDFDQELLAPRFRAAEDALALVARAARRVGARAGGGRVLIQTRLPEHPAVLAAVQADPARVSADEAPRREMLALPPFSALALVTGAGADEFAASVRAAAPAGVDVLGPSPRGYLVRAPDHATLTAVIGACPRPAARTRVEIDPRRV